VCFSFFSLFFFFPFFFPFITYTRRQFEMGRVGSVIQVEQEPDVERSFLPFPFFLFFPPPFSSSFPVPYAGRGGDGRKGRGRCRGVVFLLLPLFFSFLPPFPLFRSPARSSRTAGSTPSPARRPRRATGRWPGLGFLSFPSFPFLSPLLPVFSVAQHNQGGRPPWRRRRIHPSFFFLPSFPSEGCRQTEPGLDRKRHPFSFSPFSLLLFFPSIRQRRVEGARRRVRQIGCLFFLPPSFPPSFLSRAVRGRKRSRAWPNENGIKAGLGLFFPPPFLSFPPLPPLSPIRAGNGSVDRPENSIHDGLVPFPPFSFFCYHVDGGEAGERKR